MGNIENLEKIFQKNKKCIVNTDLDGILSGMLLQKFLNWEVVGFSSCCGKQDDELWLEDKKANLNECVFVDLPVCVKEISVIDQHFVAFDSDQASNFLNDPIKINPNIIRNKVFKTDKGTCEYTQKYPFGTVHFILACLEKLGLIDSDFQFTFDKKLNGFDSADLFLRADRVIGNTFFYTTNCFDWSDWLINLGKANTKFLFNLVKTEYKKRKENEQFVEKELTRLGCKGIDGDCSNMFRDKNYEKIIKYFDYLSDAINIKALPVFKICDFSKLAGKRFEVHSYNYDVLKKESEKTNMFSYAFVTMKTISVTYMEE